MSNKKINKEKLRTLTDECGKAIIDMLNNRLPETGEFRPQKIFFDIPEKQNTAYLCIKGFDGDKRQLYVGVTIEGTHYEQFAFIPLCNTKDKIINYLNDEKNVSKLTETLLKLSDEVDEAAHEHPFYSE